MKIPLDIIVYRLVRAYLRATSMRRAALKVHDELYCITMAGGKSLSLPFFPLCILIVLKVQAQVKIISVTIRY